MRKQCNEENEIVVGIVFFSVFIVLQFEGRTADGAHIYRVLLGMTKWSCIVFSVFLTSTDTFFHFVETKGI